MKLPISILFVSLSAFTLSLHADVKLPALFSDHAVLLSGQTKSNSYTVYFQEGRDQVVSEFRGSSLIERSIDASDPALPDFTAASSIGKSLDDYYRFRILNTKRFVP